MKKTVAVAITERLKAFGIKYFFQLTGGDQPLWIALKEAGIKMVLARSEASSVYMADGYARASMQPGITYGQAGPGAANVAAALADPYWAQSPVLALTGATASGNMYKSEYQSLNQMPLFSPITKWNAFTVSPEKTPEMIIKALNQAVSGTKGPVHLDIPKNYFGMEIDVEPPSQEDFIQPKAMIPDRGAVVEAVEHLLKSERPVILAGDGAVCSGAASVLLKISEIFQIPVATTMGGKTAFPSTHQLNLGIIGRYSSRNANDMVSQSDCVLVAGSRLGGLATKGWTVPSDKARIIQIDQDPDAFHMSYSKTLPILGDIKKVLEIILEEGLNRISKNQYSSWSEHSQKQIQKWRAVVEKETKRAVLKKPISPLQIVSVLSEFNREITLVADTGYMAAWTGVLYNTVSTGSYFRAIGSLGWALPASLGVQIARPEKVVCVSGDGGIGYHLADIETAVRLRIPVILIILNNSSLAFEYHEQKYLHKGQVISEANDLSDVDYGKLGKCLGAEGVRVTTIDEFRNAFRKGLVSDKPTVIDVVIDKEEHPPVTNFERVKEKVL